MVRDLSNVSSMKNQKCPNQTGNPNLQKNLQKLNKINTRFLTMDSAKIMDEHDHLCRSVDKLCRACMQSCQSVQA